jgi:hypothetical protein
MFSQIDSFLTIYYARIILWVSILLTDKNVSLVVFVALVAFVADVAEKLENHFTIGHSTRTIEQFIALLGAHGIEELVDVRTVPRSRHNPQFGKEELAASLQQAGIAYIHLGKLGGLRHASKTSVNTGWQNTSFLKVQDGKITYPEM